MPKHLARNSKAGLFFDYSSNYQTYEENQTVQQLVYGHNISYDSCLCHHTIYIAYDI